MYIAVIWYKKNWKPVSFVIAEYKYSGCILHCHPDKPKKKTFPPRDATNKLFSICSKPLFQSKVKCKAIEVKIFFTLVQIEHIFKKKKDFALNLLLKVTVFKIQIWESGVFT